MAKAVEMGRLLGYKVRETEKAILFECHEINNLSLADEDGKVKQEWFPYSQVDKIYLSGPNSQEYDWIMVPAWLLRKKEIL